MKLKTLSQNRSICLKMAAVIYALLLSITIFLYDNPGTQHIFYTFATVPHLDKVGHLVVMGCFSLFVNLALSGRSISISNIKYLLGSVIVFAFATLEEVSQLFVRGRDFELSDMFFNTAGIILFGEAARLIIKIDAHFQATPDGPAKTS